MRISLTFVFLILFAISGSGQDKLVLTNGKIKDIKGVVVYTDHEDVRYQRKDEMEREQIALKRIAPDHKGHIWELYGEQDSVKTGLPEGFAEEIKKKMTELSPEEFEEWKKDRYLELKEKELLSTIGGSKKQRRVLARYTKRKKRDLVFSILKPDGTEIIVYSPDTLGFLAEDTIPDLEYGIAEMRAYMQGRRDGRKHRKGDAWIGGAVGTVSAFGGAFYGPIGPAAYIGIMTIFNAKPQDRAVSDRSLLEIQAYVDGYERSAKSKKVRNFALGSLVGLGVGFGLYQVTFR